MKLKLTGRTNLFLFYMKMLKEVGATFIPFRDMEPKREARPGDWYKAAQGRVGDRLRVTDAIKRRYVERPSGSLLRANPKRDRSITARQWKKRTREARRQAVRNG